MIENANKIFYLLLGYADGTVAVKPYKDDKQNFRKMLMTGLEYRLVAWAKLINSAFGETAECFFREELLVTDPAEEVLVFDFDAVQGKKVAVNRERQTVWGIIEADEDTNGDIEALNDLASEMLTGGYGLQGIAYELVGSVDGGYIYRASGYLDDADFDEMLERQLNGRVEGK